jgi:hypothetical protein
MVRRLIQAFVALALVTVGLTAVAATPASAAWGGCNNANVTLKPCVNFGANGDNVRADFYLDRTPDSSVHHYKVYLVENGVFRVGATGTFDHTGRYCCWYWNTHSSSGTYVYHVYTRVYVYTSSGAVHMIVDSPTANYAN